MSEYESRVVHCAQRGHQFVTWHLRALSGLVTRLLCQHCGMSYVPMTQGAGAVPLTAEK